AFPRTIAGELLHDCAVYAAVVCYWLLNLERLLDRKHQIKLRLEAWFVTLPVHLGLLVKVNPEGFPSEVNGLPAGGILIVHNSHVHGMSAKELGDTMSGQWKPERPPADVDPRDAATLTQDRKSVGQGKRRAVREGRMGKKKRHMPRARPG